MSDEVVYVDSVTLGGAAVYPDYIDFTLMLYPDDATDRRIVFMLQETASQSVVNRGVIQGGDSNPVTFRISNLSPGTSYRLTVYSLGGDILLTHDFYTASPMPMP